MSWSWQGYVPPNKYILVVTEFVVKDDLPEG